MRMMNRVAAAWILIGALAQAQDSMRIVQEQAAPAPTKATIQRGKMLKLRVEGEGIKSASWEVFPFVGQYETDVSENGLKFVFTGELGSYNISCTAWNGTGYVNRRWIAEVIEGEPGPTPTPNRSPIAITEAYRAMSGQTLIIPAPGVLSNDSDPDGDAITAAVASTPDHGELQFSANGAFSYTPHAGFSGQDRLGYTVRDARGAASPITYATIDVAGVVDPFAASLQAAFDTETSANKRIHAAKLADFYESASTLTVNDERLKTAGDLFTEMNRAVKTIGLPTGALSKVNFAIADELDKLLPTSPSVPLDATIRAQITVVFRRVSQALRAMK